MRLCRRNQRDRRLVDDGNGSRCPCVICAGFRVTKSEATRPIWLLNRNVRSSLVVVPWPTQLVELADVADVAAGEPVDRLPVVADAEDGRRPTAVAPAPG